jgi:hypothetical protein
MTEAEWRTSDDPQKMLEVLREKASDRQLRLFACACCRRIWHLLTEPYCQAVVVAERFADGLAAAVERKQTKGPLLAASTPGGYFTLQGKLKGAVCAALDRQASCAARGAAKSAWGAAFQADPASAEPAAQAVLLRDIFGNPFRPATVDPAWVPPSVAAVAHACYKERRMPAGELDPVRLGVLADALEEVGSSGDLVDHLREPGPHVRGCFVIDHLIFIDLLTNISPMGFLKDEPCP